MIMSKGTYWGPVSTQNCSNIVESSDCYIFVGPIFSDYTTCGWSSILLPDKLINISPNSIDICGSIFTNINMNDFLNELALVIPCKDASIIAHRRIHGTNTRTNTMHLVISSNDILTLNEFQHHIQNLLTTESDLLVDTGNSWFIGQKFNLPMGSKFHIQMLYGSTGWSIGAALGCAIAYETNSIKRDTIVIIGDGAFQMSFQEISTMIREGINCTMFVINNGGYTIDIEIHDGPYNKINNWDYAGIVDVFNGPDTPYILTSSSTSTIDSKLVISQEHHPSSKGVGIRVKTSNQLAHAIEVSKHNKGFTLIEVILGMTDCTPELLAWGSRIFASNSK